MKTENTSLAVPLACALAILWAAVVAGAVAAMPRRIPLSATETLRAYDLSVYFIQAQGAAKRLWADPASRWSHLGEDGDTMCFLLGNGIWMARGHVDLPSSAGEPRLNWEVIFVPGEPGPRFARVGDRHMGNRDAAGRAAGRKLPREL